VLQIYSDNASALDAHGPFIVLQTQRDHGYSATDAYGLPLVLQIQSDQLFSIMVSALHA